MRVSQIKHLVGRGIVSRHTLAVMVLTLLMLPSSAGALGKMPAHGVLLSYEQQYSAITSDEQRFHRGVDIGYCAGEAVPAPVSGVVTFAGKIPTESGDRVQAVTVTTALGHLVTLLPLDVIEVKKGQSIALGERLGVLASYGDSSTDEPHIHISLRVNSVYNNPGQLIDSLLACAMAASDDSVSGYGPAGNESSDTGDLSGRGDLDPSGAINGLKRTSTTPSSMRSSQLSHAANVSDGVAATSSLTTTKGLDSVGASMHRGTLLHYSRVKMSDERLVGGIMSLRLSRVSPIAKGSPSLRHTFLQYLSSLSHVELFATLFLMGIALPCAGVGVYTICSRMGINISSIRRIVAARDE